MPDFKSDNSMLACLLAPLLVLTEETKMVRGYNRLLMPMAFNCHY
jgi:hypothetical protein